MVWCLWVYLMWSLLSCWINRFMSHQNMGHYQPLFPWIHFQFYCFSSPSDPSMILMLAIPLLFHSSLLRSTLISALFLCCSDWINSTHLSSGSLFLSSVIPTLLLSLFSEFFSVVILIFCSTFPFHSFLWFLFLYWGFLVLFSCFNGIWN